VNEGRQQMKKSPDITGGPEARWSVYIILCSDDSLYTGITTDPERRLGQHAAGRGARYFRGRQPLRLVYLEHGHSRSSASQRECLIKSMPKGDKARLIAEQSAANGPKELGLAY